MRGPTNSLIDGAVAGDGTQPDGNAVWSPWDLRWERGGRASEPMQLRQSLLQKSTHAPSENNHRHETTMSARFQGGSVICGRMKDRNPKRSQANFPVELTPPSVGAGSTAAAPEQRELSKTVTHYSPHVLK